MTGLYLVAKTCSIQLNSLQTQLKRVQSRLLSPWRSSAPGVPTLAYSLQHTMAVITLTDAQLAYGHHALLDHAEFSLESGERVGLIGRNGTGKSSLLKIISGSNRLDDGLLVMQQNLKIVYVEQEPQFEAGISVFAAVTGGLAETAAKLQRYHEISGQLGQPGADDDAIMHEMHDIQLHLDAHDGWNLDNRVATCLQKLSLPGEALVSELSGGTRKRVALARALVAAPDVLLLDEPTNHLDFNAIRWLEELLAEFKGSVLFITHDRSFLDNVASRIIELDRGKLLSFPGNFTTYKQRKAELLENEEVENAKFDKLLAQEEIWIRKGVKARRVRDEGRVKRLEQLRLQRAARREQQGQVKMEISQAERSGKIVAELVEVDKAFADRRIVSNFSCTIMRGDKIGLIGPNGVGKSTLLKLILGEIQADRGQIRQGSNLQIAYFDQMRAQLNEELSLAETISPGSDWVEVNGQRKHVMSYLGDFLFAPERARSPVKSLSGGERNRLLLARLFAKPANVMVLDEPTNDLDIETLELLEELLEEYSGTVFLVSHDRAFLDNVVTQVIVAQGEGEWLEFVGGYSDWDRYASARLAAQAQAEKASKVTEKAPEKASVGAGVNTADSKTANKKAAKLSFKEQRELAELPDKIAAIEAEQAQITAALSDTDLYKNGADKAQQLNARFAELDEALLAAMTRWEEIESKAQAGA